MKLCSKCKQEKPLADYCKDAQKSDGLHPHCKSCRREAHKVRYVPRSRPTTESRFWAKVRKGADGECWLWTGSLWGGGYGQFWDGADTVPAHVYSFKLSGQDLPRGLLVCHRCDVRNCVNPDHLFAGTYGDNNRDTRDKGRRFQPDVSGENNGRYKHGKYAGRKRGSRK
jgi:hypothetical protein